MIAITAVNHLDHAECWRLLQNAHVGRLATAVNGLVDIIPLNYLVHNKTLLFRCAEESRLGTFNERPDVAFEIDGEDSRWYWTVTVQGKAERLLSEEEITESGGLKLVGWSRTNRFEFIRLIPEGLEGRRVDRHEFRRSSRVA